jgi:hypothetical protein
MGFRQRTSDLFKVLFELTKVPCEPSSQIKRICKSLSKLYRRICRNCVARLDRVDLILQFSLLLAVIRKRIFPVIGRQGLCGLA